MKIEIDRYRTPDRHLFVVKHTRNTSGVELFDPAGKRIAYEKRTWGPSKADAFGMAGYVGDPRRCDSAMCYLFGRDSEAYRRWQQAVFVGQPESELRRIVYAIQRLAIWFCGPEWMRKRMLYSHPY